MFNEKNFVDSLEALDNVPCNLSFNETKALVNIAKQSDSDLEYAISCAFCLGYERKMSDEQH